MVHPRAMVALCYVMTLFSVSLVYLEYWNSYRKSFLNIFDPLAKFRIKR